MGLQILSPSERFIFCVQAYNVPITICQRAQTSVKADVTHCFRNYALYLPEQRTQTYHIPTSLQDYHQHSFYPRTVHDWNILPETIVMATSFETFRGLISQ